MIFVEALVSGAIESGVASGGVGNGVEGEDGAAFEFDLRLNANFDLGAVEARRSSSFCPKLFNCYDSI